MCRDSVFSAEIYRSSPEFAFHNPEAFFHLPSFLIDADDRCCIIFQVCTYGIEAVIAFFFSGSIFIHRSDHLVCSLTVRGTVILTDKPFGIVRSFSFQKRGVANKFFGTFKLPAAYLSHIVPVLTVPKEKAYNVDNINEINNRKSKRKNSAKDPEGIYYAGTW